MCAVHVDMTVPSGLANVLLVVRNNGEVLPHLARDGQILNIAREAAPTIITSDPEERNPQNDFLWRRLRELRMPYR